MKTMKMAALVVTTMLGAMLAGCAADEVASEAEPENLAATQQAMDNGSGVTGKTKADLEADGYTCTTMSGTTVTLCWKNGSPGYTCNDRGTCTQDAKAPTRPIYVRPPTGILLSSP